MSEGLSAPANGSAASAELSARTLATNASSRPRMNGCRAKGWWRRAWRRISRRSPGQIRSAVATITTAIRGWSVSIVSTMMAARSGSRRIAMVSASTTSAAVGCPGWSAARSSARRSRTSASAAARDARAARDCRPSPRGRQPADHSSACGSNPSRTTRRRSCARRSSKSPTTAPGRTVMVPPDARYNHKLFARPSGSMIHEVIIVITRGSTTARRASPRTRPGRPACAATRSRPDHSARPGSSPIPSRPSGIRS